MTDTPEFDDFKTELRKLKTRKPLKPLLRRGDIQLRRLALTDVAALMLEDAARYFLLAAANLNRTQLKKATSDPEAVLVEKKLRQAYAVRERLPLTAPNPNRTLVTATPRGRHASPSPSRYDDMPAFDAE